MTDFDIISEPLSYSAIKRWEDTGILTDIINSEKDALCKVLNNNESTKLGDDSNTYFLDHNFVKDIVTPFLSNKDFYVMPLPASLDKYDNPIVARIRIAGRLVNGELGKQRVKDYIQQIIENELINNSFYYYCITVSRDGGGDIVMLRFASSKK